jgi:hypothetical protein
MGIPTDGKSTARHSWEVEALKTPATARDGPGAWPTLTRSADMAETTAPEDTYTSSADPVSGGTVQEWLAAAHPSPSTVRNEWSGVAQLALIPLGQSFEAVRIPEDIVHAVARSDEASTVNTWLAQRVDGPVVHDPGCRRYYALVPPGTCEMWATRAAECLGEGTYLGVPRTDRTELDDHTRASYWSVPMSRPGALCKAATVLEVVALGSLLADDADDS